jgi:superfamily II DNA/RNA helicase
MEQFKEEILIHRPDLKQSIQLIGDGKISFNTKHKITICVYNSIEHVIPHINTFHKIYIDEAHHIKTPLIYEDVNYNDEDSDEEKESYLDYNESDDEDLEEKEDDKKYISIISDLSKYNNNIYLSATIDEQQGFKYYKKDIRDMIEQEYLCDYTINIPIFDDDPTNKNICEYLIKNYKNIIIYCDSQKEGKKVNKLINSIQKGCSEYIDCNTSKKKRNDIIKSYKNGDIPFLVNVRILVEGFDAPITKGVCFFHLPSNKTTIIQIIGRALRLHPLKTLASIILPFSNKDDEESIVNFIRELSQNDPRIKQAYMEKRTTGYLNITKVEEDSDDNKDDYDEKDEKEQNSIDLRYELIYNSFGVLVNRLEVWEDNLTKVKKYIDDNKKRPSTTDKDETIKQLGKWLSHQTENYKGNKHNMKDENIKKKWEEFIQDDKYKEYFK